MPSQSAKSRSGRSVAASSDSKPAWPEVNDGIKRDRDSCDPIPIGSADADSARMLNVEAFEPDPNGHEKIFGRAGDEMQQMHPERRPNNGGVGVIVPAEFQSAELEKAQADRAETDDDHYEHADAHSADIHAQTGKIDNHHWNTASEQQEQAQRGKAEIGLGSEKRV